jgi:hypothetical protein
LTAKCIRSADWKITRYKSAIDVFEKRYLSGEFDASLGLDGIISGVHLAFRIGKDPDILRRRCGPSRGERLKLD